MKIWCGRLHGVPREKMRPRRFVAAFVAVGAKGYAGAQREVRIENAQERERDAVFRRPAVRCSGTNWPERLLLGLVAEPDTLVPVGAETELYAGIGVDLKVYITSIVRK